MTMLVDKILTIVETKNNLLNNTMFFFDTHSPPKRRRVSSKPSFAITQQTATIASRERYVPKSSTERYLASKIPNINKKLERTNTVSAAKKLFVKIKV